MGTYNLSPLQSKVIWIADDRFRDMQGSYKAAVSIHNAMLDSVMGASVRFFGGYYCHLSGSSKLKTVSAHGF